MCQIVLEDNLKNENTQMDVKLHANVLNPLHSLAGIFLIIIAACRFRGSTERNLVHTSMLMKYSDVFWLSFLIISLQ